MPPILTNVAAFLVAILVLVTIHEYGHFWVARRLGVKVRRFSIGFGRPLFTWRRRGDDTEYVIAALPLGGYVKMLDEREEEAPIPPADLPFAFNRQPVWKRSLVVLAGPLANFLLAVLIYWGLLMAGETGVRPEVGTVEPHSVAAEAGFAPGDLVTEVDGRPVATWGNFWFALLSASLGHGDVTVDVTTADGDAAVRTLPAAELAPLDPGQGFLGEVGLQSYTPSIPPVIAEVVPGEPAAAADLRPGDRIVSIDGEHVGDWDALVTAVQARAGQTVSLVVERGGARQTLTLTPRAVTLDDGSVIGRIGAGPAVPEDLYDDIEVVVRYGPAGGLLEALRRVGDVSVMTLRIIGRMLVGSASVQNLSGPIGIADAAGKTVRFGIAPYLEFIALLSVSLGLLNLLPIPVLDGGHLLFFAIEAVLRRPVSEELQAQGQRLGLFLILCLMTLAFYVDIARIFG
ncbi:MAG: RIP metalloprotease RseP [Thiohalocapsa sp.]|jgi:regulator of sigma E protease|uniref:RIP metalloprotease RseP n=1 Tax=Thiohalocapsa sp. TaxID=2497641 RepID=UPI0025DDF349|nr:RIP metalloprotease RseP [Thiohalocapsa sp.]MCG6943321.1 RIP metalloprotease RseP [Thiohalocapsa sp.]